jgi:hypothetical protein
MQTKWGGLMIIIGIVFWLTKEEEEGEEYENVAYHHGKKAGQEEAHVEEGLLYQPVGGEEGNGHNI